MTDGPKWYQPDYKAPAAASRPGEPLWTLYKGGRTVLCELRDHGEFGVEVQLVRDGEFYAGRRFNTRELASAHGAAVRARLERDGWTAASNGVA